MNVMQTHAPLHTANFAHPPRNVGALGIEPGMLVADFGSGSGAYALLIAEALRTAGRVYAVDIQKDLLQRIKNESQRRGLQNVEVLWGDLEGPSASKIADRKLDLVLISNLLFQLEDKAAPLAEAQRILKPTGRLAIIDWSDPALSSRHSVRIGPDRKSVVPKEKIVDLAGRAGFELQREFDAGAHHYGLMFAVASPMSP